MSYELSIYQGSARIARIARATAAQAWRDAVHVVNTMANADGVTTRVGYEVSRCARGQRVSYQRGIYRCSETMMRSIHT